METDKLVLRKLDLRDESAFLKAVGLWDGARGFQFASDYSPGMDFGDFLEFLRKRSSGIDLPPDRVPDTKMCAFMANEIVGRLSLRHTLNDFLVKIGGHIGYGVLPHYRGRGFAKEMLRQALPMAKGLGLDRVLVTCEDDNVGSYRVIEFCGGVLENRTEQGEGKPLLRRYWIEIF